MSIFLAVSIKEEVLENYCNILKNLLIVYEEPSKEILENLNKSWNLRWNFWQIYEELHVSFGNLIKLWGMKGGGLEKCLRIFIAFFSVEMKENF